MHSCSQEMTVLSEGLMGREAVARGVEDTEEKTVTRTHRLAGLFHSGARGDPR